MVNAQVPRWLIVFLVFMFIGLWVVLTRQFSPNFGIYRLFWVNISLVTAMFFVAKNWAKQPVFRFTSFDFVWLMIVLFNFASIAWAQNPSEALKMNLYLLPGWWWFYLQRGLIQQYSGTSGEGQLISLVGKIAVITSLFLSAHTFFALAKLQTYLNSLQYDGGINSTTIFGIADFSGNKNVSASLLVLLLPLCLLPISFKTKDITRQQKIWRILAIFAGIANIVTIVILQSRTAFLGLLVLLTASLAARVIVNGKLTLPARKVWLWIAGIFASILIVAAISLNNVGDLAERLNIANYAGSKTAIERGALWQKTIELMQQNPLAGCGLNNWKIAMPGLGLDGLTRMQEGRVTFVHPHNEFLLAGAETGWPGLLLLVSFCGLPVYYGLRILRWASKLPPDNDNGNDNNNNRQKIIWFTCICVAAVCSFVLMAMFTSPRMRIELILALNFPLAWLVNTYAQYLTKTPPKRLHLGVWGLVLVSSFFGGYASWQYLKAGSYTNKLAAEYTNKDWEALISTTTLAYHPLWNTISPPCYPIQAFWANAYAALDSADLAKYYYNAALTDHPNHYLVLNSKGDMHFKNNEYEKARIAYLQSVQINSIFEEGKLSLAETLIKLQRPKKAVYWLQQIAPENERRQQLITKLPQKWQDKLATAPTVSTANTAPTEPAEDDSE